jgi:rhodanese-related sulfurtransferase
MIEVYKNLFVGDQTDYDRNIRLQSDWNIIHACKEPYHRDALGYTGRGAPKHHPEYLIAYRGNRLILNLVDADSSKYIPKEIIDEALKYIDECLDKEEKILLHCNQGRSRSVGIAMLFLAIKGVINSNTFKEAEQDFKEIYPPCNLSGGIRGFLQQNWNQYIHN